MATTTPNNLRTPNGTDPYNLVSDLGVLANDVQNALTQRANFSKGTAAQRAAFLSTATDGWQWQDTDGIKMFWRKDGASWVPAVSHWTGTIAQRTSFTQAFDGFEWQDTDGPKARYIRIGSTWEKYARTGIFTTSTGALSPLGTGDYFTTISFTLTPAIPAGYALWVSGINTGSGVGDISLSSYASTASNTTVYCRFTQHGSATAQTVSILWSTIRITD